MANAFDDEDFFKDYPTYQNEPNVNPTYPDDDPFGGSFNAHRAASPPHAQADDASDPLGNSETIFAFMHNESMKADGADEGSFAFVMQGDAAPEGASAGEKEESKEEKKEEKKKEQKKEEIGKPIARGDGPPRPSTPTAVKQWRADFAKKIEDKKAKEGKTRAEDMKSSQAAITKMYQKYKERAQANEDHNRAEEKKVILKRDGTNAQISKPGKEPNWNVLPELCDLSGAFVQGQRETARMRSVITKLKT